MLSRRLSPEDVVQETFASALMREDFFTNEPEVPLYFKLRTILFQTMVDLERRHLAAQKRDAYKEVDVPRCDSDDTSAGDLDWDMFAGTVTAPNSVLAREDRHALLRQAIGELSENDRQIIILRHFDDMDNAECARVLGRHRAEGRLHPLRPRAGAPAEEARAVHGVPELATAPFRISK